MKRALVTGACGFLGSLLVDHLLEEGWQVRATDLPEADRSSLPRDIDWVAADLTRPDTLDPAVQNIHVIFHVAAIFDFSAPWESLYRVNVLGTENLLEAAGRSGVRRIVNWSSYGVYGRFDRTCMPIDETHPVRPKDPYGRSKAMQDAVVWRYHERGLPATVIRPSAPYGPRSRYGMAELFGRLNLLPVVPVPWNLTNRVMSVHGKDVVRAAAFLATREDAAGEEYNITDDGRYNTRTFISLLARSLGKKILPVYVPIPLLKAGAWTAAYASLGLSRLLRSRPWLEKDTVYYLTFDFQPTNAKVKATGFEFLYPDPETGIPETVEAYRREGFLR